MRWAWLLLALLAAAPAAAQRIVELSPGEANLAPPVDLYDKEPGRWHLGKQLWSGDEPCTPTQCEAGYTSGDLVVSAEHNLKKVTIVAALRGCPSVAFSEIDIGDRASGSERRRVGKQVQRVVRGLGKTCKMTPPSVAELHGDWLFPAAAAS